MKTFALLSPTGRCFSFNAHDTAEAQDKLSDWLLYHSIRGSDYSVVETSEAFDLHNEFVA